MKSIVLLVGICCVVSWGAELASPEASEEVRQTFEDFRKLIPKVKLVALVAKHYLLDKDFRKAQSFIKSSEFEEEYTELLASPEFQKLDLYLQQFGLRLVHELNSLGKGVGLPTEPEEEINSFEFRSTSSFIDELISALPKNDITDLYNSEIEAKPAFKRLTEALDSQEFRDYSSAIAESSAGLKFVDALKSKSIDVGKVLNFIQTLFGLHLV